MSAYISDKTLLRLDELIETRIKAIELYIIKHYVFEEVCHRIYNEKEQLLEAQAEIRNGLSGAVGKEI